ncbi:MAG: PA14 domain-containing protein [Planctomycetaceae bacterium]
MRNPLLSCACLFVALTCSLSSAFAQSEMLDLNRGDHIAIIGNTLADRMQHFGWTETMLQTRFPQHELVVRNLGFSGDTLTTRPRSQNFGTPDEWLTKVEADVIFAFFGYNESFAGETGLPQFRDDLKAFIDHTLSQQYNGESAPRLVLFSPIAHENLRSRLLPDGTENNQRLEMYSAAMSAVAEEKGVPFVDLFAASKTSYSQTNDHSSPLRPDPQKPPGAVTGRNPAGSASFTINGVHATDQGYQMLATVMDRTLFGSGNADRDSSRDQTVCQAVREKNHVWHNIYRATDGFSVFGGRSGLQFVDGQTNFEVMQRELEMLNVMTSNRDKVIWAAAGASEITPDDSNLPAAIPVQTNKAGTLDGGLHRFLGGEEAIEQMTMHQGMEANLFASEEQFPELVNPVQSAVDADGRLWVAAWPSYPHWNPREALNDKLLILPDDDGDGRADRCITFADGLHNPTGFEFWNGGVLLAQAPDIFFLKDTDGDDRADIRLRMFHGIDSADTHHTANSFVMDPAGRFYFSRGIFHFTNMETPTQIFRSDSGRCGVFQFDPLTWEVKHHFQIGPNPHGDTFDQWGNQFATDGTGGTGNYIGFPGRGAPKQLYEKRVRPVPAITILDSDHFPDQLRGNLLIANVIGFQGITQYRFSNDGASMHATEVEPIVYSTDPNFRPSDMEIGGDGALYVLDWQNPLIGHMQHNLRDPSRDHLHGRVYRITASGRELMPVAKFRGKPIADVVRVLASDTLSERYRARLELTDRDSQEVLAAVDEWAAGFDALDTAHARDLTEALWVYQQKRVPNRDLLHRVLSSPEPNARAAAVRVLTEWGMAPDFRLPPAESVADAIRRLANDASPLVRAQAVIAAVEVNPPNAAEVLFAAMQHPTDLQIDFNLAEAKRSIDLNAYIREQLAAGRQLSPAARAYAIANAGVDDLLKLQRTEDVYRAILTREDVPLAALQESLAGLATLKQTPEIEQLFGLIEELNDEANANVLGSLSRLLSSRTPEELRRVRDRIVSLALDGKSAEAREVAFASWITADGNGTAAFAAVADNDKRTAELLRSVPLVAMDVQPELLPGIRRLIAKLPGSVGNQPLSEPGIRVEYFHPSPSNVAVETLANMTPQSQAIVPDIRMEVPILKQRDQFALRFTGSLRIEQPGRYSFFTTSDDGSRLYIGSELVVNNDGLHGMSSKRGRTRLAAGLHPITVTYFDNGGGDGLQVEWEGPGFSRQPIPASALVVASEETMQELAIRSLMQIPGFEKEKAGNLIGLIRDGQSLNTAMTSLAAISADFWPQQQLGQAAQGLTRYIADTDPRQRNSSDATRAFALARQVAEHLPADTGKQRLLRRLDELAVPLIEIGTVPERMIYSKEILAVQSGRPVEFMLTNADNMPHNFAVLKPGTLEAVGELAEATGREPDAAARNFIPETDDILESSKLLQPGQSDRVFLEVPTETGIYPYVCTYPGHWRRMYGALYVVDDLRAYEADPAAWLSAHSMEMKDELLKYLGRNTEWKLADLQADTDHLMHRANNFKLGQQLFKVASCVGCHRLNDQGANIGPDLTKLPKEYTATDVLDHMLNPSKKIDEKYQSNIFILSSGKTVTGLVVKETDDEVTLVDNPSDPEKTTTISKSDIDEREISKVSIMPQGVLNKLTKAEILDLLAYVVSRGDQNNELFEGDHDHQH